MPVYDVSGNVIGTAYDANGQVLPGYYDVNGDPIVKPTPDITVMTFNPQGWVRINSQSAMLTAIYQRYTPDIVGVQEAGWESGWPSSSNPFTGNFSYKYKSTNITNPNGILSTLALSNYTETIYTYSDDETWAYSKCYITVNNTTVAWYNTHLTWEGTAAAQEGRRLQAAQMLADAETEDYVIITGDFNIWGYVYGSTDYVNVLKPFVDAGYKLANFDNPNHCIPTYSGATSATSIMEFTDGCDNIIISPNIDFIDVYFDDTKLDYLNGDPIDHIPIVATLKIVR